MKPPVEEVRISAKAKEILIRLKRRTGIQHWNELCRVAYCRALKEAHVPEDMSRGDVGVRMEWKTFGGPDAEIYTGLSMLRAERDGIDTTSREARARHFHLMLEYGISCLRDVSNLDELYAGICD